MTKEEKKAVEELKILKNSEYSIMLTPHGADVFLTIIEKQQKEIEELKRKGTEDWEERCRIAIELEKEIQQEKEKNKELEKENKKLDEKFRYAVPDDMIHELYVSKELYKQEKEKEDLQNYIKQNLIPKSTINLLYISKDKIKAKINELEYDQLYEPNKIVEDRFKIEILKELLEENEFK